jgi:hypothetical protein
MAGSERKQRAVFASVAALVLLGAGASLLLRRSRIERITPAPPRTIPLPADVTLPTSSASQPPTPDALLLVLSPKRLALWPDERALAVPPPDAAKMGFAPSDKKNGRTDLLITPLLEALLPRFSRDAAAPDLLFAIDATVPYRLVEEVISTVAQTGAPRQAILVRSGDRQAVIPIPLEKANSARPCYVEAKRSMQVTTSAIDDAGFLAWAPPFDAGGPAFASSLPSKPPLCLTVIVDDRGFEVHAFGAAFAPGCEESGTGAAVPKHDGAYSFTDLTACAARLKARASEADAIVSATPGTDWQTVVATLDALRGGAEKEPLFPHFALGLPR